MAKALYTITEIVATLARVTGQKIDYIDGNLEDAGLAFPPAMRERLKGIAGLITDYAYFGPTGESDLRWTLEQMEDRPRSWEDLVKRTEPWFEHL